MFHVGEVACTQWHTATHVRLDKAAGEATCHQCGLVLRARLIRTDTFAAAHGANDMANKNPINLTSTIGSFCNDRAPTNGQQARKRVQNRCRQRRLERWQNRISMDYHSERFLYLVYVMIDEFVERMELSKRVGECAKALMRQYHARPDKPVKKTKILAAVFTFMACRRLRRDRSFESFVSSGLVRKRELGSHL